MGFGELVLITVIVVVVSGATKLPSLGEGLGESMERWREQQQRAQRVQWRFRREKPHRWRLSDWALVIAAVALGAVVTTNALVAAFRRP